MMQAGSNLIFSSVSDTTVTSWVRRPRARLSVRYNAARDTDHICSKSLNLVFLKGNTTSQKESEVHQFVQYGKAPSPKGNEVTHLLPGHTSFDPVYLLDVTYLNGSAVWL